MSSRPNYGIDSPAIVTGLLLLSGIGVGATILLQLFSNLNPFWKDGLVLAGMYFLLSACGMISYSKVGKPRIRDQILESVPWRGDEMVLDVGCGRGLVLVGAARRLSTGKAIGLDC